MYRLVRLFPRGRVTTYGALADALLLPNARMAGYAMRHSLHAGIAVPAHRVVNASGRLSGAGHFPTPTMMAELLASEGVAVERGRVVAFAERFWDPLQA